MADNNQNISGDSTSAREQLERSARVRREQGDYLNLVKDSELALKRLITSYETIEGKINALNKGTINIRDINRQLYKENEKLQTLKSRERTLSRDISESQKTLIQEYSRMTNLRSEDLDALQEMLNSQEQAYFNYLRATDLAEKNVDFANKKLDIEKQTNSSVGITGRLLGSIGRTLGGNNEAYEEMVEKTRELVETTGKGLSFSEKLSFIWKGVKSGISGAVQEMGGWGKAIGFLVVVGMKKLADLAGSFAKSVANGVASFMTMSGDQVIGKLTSGISSIVGKLPFVGGLLSGIVEAFGKLLELSLAEDDKITKIGRELGVSKAEATAINDQFLKISVASGRTLISSRALVESQKELTNELGVANVFSGEILATNIELGKLAGLDVKTRASIAESATITGRRAKEITASVLGQVGALKAATGISLNYKKVLSEASSLGGFLGLQFAKYPEKLTKALVTTKSMGLELGKLNSMADSFLNFESSISKEFEAQLLTGKNLNLMKAREAFLNNDLVTAAQEITRQVGSSNDFLKMNRLQQDSIAEAMGMSRDEMANMLKQQEMLSKLGAKDLKDAQAKIEALKAQGKSREEIAKLVGEEAYQNITNASAQEKIAGFIEKIQDAVANFLSKSPIIPIVERAIDFLSEPANITAIVQKIQRVFADIFDIAGSLTAGVMKIANVFGAGISDSLIAKAKSGGSFIRALNLGESLSVSENAARGSTGGYLGNISSSGGSMAGSPQNMNLHVTTYVTDNYKEAELRYSMASRGDQGTSLIGKK